VAYQNAVAYAKHGSRADRVGVKNPDKPGGRDHLHADVRKMLLTARASPKAAAPCVLGRAAGHKQRAHADEESGSSVPT